VRHKNGIVFLNLVCVCQEMSVGLSWREETELRKALYASLQKQRHREKDDPNMEALLSVGKLTPYWYRPQRVPA